MISTALAFCWRLIRRRALQIDFSFCRCFLLLSICTILFSKHVVCSRIPRLIPRDDNLLISRILADNSSSSCPVTFQFVNRFPATIGACRNDAHNVDFNICCSALLNTFGIGISEYLGHTGFFEFPDNASAYTCLDAYQEQLHANGISVNFVNSCFPLPYPDPAMFVRNPRLCAGITTTADWKRVVGPSPMDASCSGDLSSQAGCQICTDDIKQVVYKLNSIDPNHSTDCVYFSVIYAAAVLNTLGPMNPSTAVCLLGMDSRDLPGKKSHKNIVLFTSIGAGCVCLLSLLLALAYGFWKRRKRKGELASLLEKRKNMLINSLTPNTGLVQFTYEELKTATQDFSQQNIIGEGGFGRVYKGVLDFYGGLQVAVKVIKNSTIEGDTEFLNEVEVINRVRHRNLLHLRGCCVASTNAEGHNRLLVYDLMPNGNLEDYLFSGTKSLSWPERRKIAIGMATGINYLHNEVEPAILHRDIKPSNILLDGDLNARVADFGLAKVAPEGISHLTTRVAGTPVYIALEYAMYGHLSDKIDVYSFGIVLLELLSGRKALDTSRGNPMEYHIVDWAWRLLKEGKVLEVIDKTIRDSSPVAVMERFVRVGILCAHLQVAFRPPISQALKMLEGDCEIPAIPDRPPSYAWSKPGDTPNACSFASSGSGCAQSSINSIDLLR
ncbi:hypothetical protein O6H91_02G041800 [Diphasiastrum complanatum]|uniref:Uncharacterized protein n=2 Tax=Diphasiastrum complanatum TaxID=34168 RepID=A0ACC2EEP3_DIPCM|nr:hypothetical protein O6H91_02G041800 [Diphasiastrum complanatum]KAJ7564964.1 hypothetical protein O6H91_02G041800 [Diphasiastrum complanatum]